MSWRQKIYQVLEREGPRSAAVSLLHQGLVWLILLNVCTSVLSTVPSVDAANGKMFVANGGSGTVAALTIKDDTAHVTILKDGIATPTGIEPAGDTLWYTERGVGKVWSMAMPK